MLRGSKIVFSWEHVPYLLARPRAYGTRAFGVQNNNRQMSLLGPPTPPPVDNFLMQYLSYKIF